MHNVGQMRKILWLTHMLLWSALFFSGCSGKQPVFQKLANEQTGIDFVNEIISTDSINVMTNPFIYNGGGIGIGDINNNGLADIFVAGNRISSKLFLNKGNMKFEDITNQAGVATERWATGISLADISLNGYLDIYVSVSGGAGAKDPDRANLLFLNNGDGTFTEAGESFGIADTGYTVHAVFLDYNLDDYLDLFLINNQEESFSREGKLRPKQDIPGSPNVDILYINNGDGTFTNVSEEAGIVKEGYSLGVAVDDINNDGWPDIFVSNDVLTNSQLWINNGDGTFTDKIAEYFPYTSYSGMGTDIGDITNDGWPDIIQTDMLPESEEERKKTLIEHGNQLYQKLAELGYSPQYMFNTLQINQGASSNGRVNFKEVAQRAGVDASEWSWAALFDDFDNNGWKDLLITNGFPKNLISTEYFIASQNPSLFGTEEARWQRRLALLENLESIEAINKLFRNNGDTTFTDKSSEWGFNTPGYSYGVATADLNLNGSLDLVIHNLNDSLSIYQNKVRDHATGRANYLQVKLHGSEKNPGAIGAKIRLFMGGSQQYRYISPYRGYMSSTDPVAHFGLGNAQKVDSLFVEWPVKGKVVLKNIEVNQRIDICYKKVLNNSQGCKESLFTEKNYLELPNDN